MNFFRFTDTRLVGDYNEDRFFRIYERALQRGGPFPSWFMGISRPPGHFDILGVDAIAQIRHRFVPGERVDVPVQIKSSRSAISKHYQRHPDHWREGIVFAVVNNERSDEAVRAHFEGELLQTWLLGWRYDDFWLSIAQSELGQLERTTLHRLEARRERVSKNTYGSPE